VNAGDFSVREAAGENVVLVEFWTYTCFNCQNVQPHINSWHDAYAGEGLQVVGVHTPEFGFEREYANVRSAVREAGIEYPVVLDNAYATWEAYDNRYWPAIYLSTPTALSATSISARAPTARRRPRSKSSWPRGTASPADRSPKPDNFPTTIPPMPAPDPVDGRDEASH
jgi:thiol-disulfide isomerase/thioredoxin